VYCCSRNPRILQMWSWRLGLIYVLELIIAKHDCEGVFIIPWVKKDLYGQTESLFTVSHWTFTTFVDRESEIGELPSSEACIYLAAVSTFDFCRRRSAFCARDAVTWEPVALLCPARRLCLARALLLPRRGAPAPPAAAAATCRKPIGTLLSDCKFATWRSGRSAGGS